MTPLLEQFLSNLPTHTFEKVTDGEFNKNIWIPHDLSKFVRIQWALDSRASANKPSLPDIIQGIVAIGYNEILELLDNEEGITFSKRHSRDAEDGDSQQYSIRMNEECRNHLADIVKWVQNGTIKYDDNAVFNMSDAMIALLEAGTNRIIANNHVTNNMWNAPITD